MNARNGHKEKASSVLKRIETPEIYEGGASTICFSDGQIEVHFVLPTRVFNSRREIS